MGDWPKEMRRGKPVKRNILERAVPGREWTTCDETVTCSNPDCDSCALLRVLSYIDEADCSMPGTSYDYASDKGRNA